MHFQELFLVHPRVALFTSLTLDPVFRGVGCGSSRISFSLQTQKFKKAANHGDTFQASTCAVKSTSVWVYVCVSHVRLCDCNLPGSSVHGIFQTRILEWLPFPSPETHQSQGPIESHGQGWNAFCHHRTKAIMSIHSAVERSKESETSSIYYSCLGQGKVNTGNGEYAVSETV